VKFVTRYWYNTKLSPPAYLDVLSRVYGFISSKRRSSFLNNKRQSFRAPVPVIVIGNISVGGTGKTPLVIALAKFLQQNNYRVGIVSRGYGGSGSDFPIEVNIDSDPSLVGDEPLLIAQQSLCPIFVGPKRQSDITALLNKYPEVNLILSDDGMQHYAMERDIEIAVIDGKRLFGNKKLLPAGPLREPVSRLDEVDIQVVNGLEADSEKDIVSENTFFMHLAPASLYRLNDKTQKKGLLDFAEQTVHGVAGIGNPQRFFDALTAQGLKVIPHDFDDHFHYKENDLIFGDQLPIIMTEKDAVKCKSFNLDNCWVVSLDTQLSEHFYEKVLCLLEKNRR